MRYVGTMFEQSFAYLVGVLMALVTIYPSSALEPARERRFLTVVIGVVVAGFVGFPISQGDPVGLAWELVALVVLGAAVVGSLRLPWLLVVAWFGLLFLLGGTPIHKPVWVCQLCVPYDWIVAAYLVSRLPKWRAADAV